MKARFQTAKFCSALMMAVGLNLAANTPAVAAVFPSKPITLISPTVPGGAMDSVARLLAQHLGPQLGQPIVVESKPGAGGTLGIALAARAPSDGHTLVIVADSYLTVAPRLMPGVALQPLKDLVPVIELGSSPMVLVANPALRVKSIAEYIEKIKAHPGKITYASAGAGSPHHLAMAMLEQQLRVRLNHIPYKGGAQALADVVAGHADSMFIVMSTAEPYLRSGKLVALGISSPKPLADYPSIPVIANQVPGYESALWFAIFAPRGTPTEIIARLNQEIGKVLTERDVVRGMKTVGIQPSGGSATSLEQKLKRDDERMARLLPQIGLKPE